MKTAPYEYIRLVVDPGLAVWSPGSREQLHKLRVAQGLRFDGLLVSGAVMNGL